MVTMTTEPPITLQQPVVVTSNKVNTGPQVLKAAPVGQGKKNSGKGKGVKPPEKGKKNVKASTSSAAASAGLSSNLRSKLHDKSKDYSCNDTGDNRGTAGYRTGILKG